MNNSDVVEVFKRRTRSPLRPRSGDVIKTIFPHFRQHPPHGGSLILGDADQWDRRIFIIGQQKPKPEDLRTKTDLQKLNYGMLTAEEHSYILRFLRKTVRRNLDNAMLVTFVDTYGADISMESARDFQAFFIARLLESFIKLPLPSISVVLGEGGSGGALAIQFCDRRAQMDDALYATAPPESMAAIIFRDPTRIREALAILKPTAAELQDLGVIDQILPAPHNVADVRGFARSIEGYLEKTVKELSRFKIAKLLEDRRTRAENFGLLSPKAVKPKGRALGRLLMLTPLKKAHEHEPPPDMKIINIEETALQVRYDYGNGLAGSSQEAVRCGDTSSRGHDEEGCGGIIPLQEYLASHYVCRHCGRSRVMGALGWINCLTDPDTFHELYRDLVVTDLLHDSHLTPEYKKFVAAQNRRTHFHESLVTGEGLIYGHRAVLAVSEFYFSGGSMGVVFGEKFHRAVEYAVEKKLPFISLCCSGGARLYEGSLALVQMVKTVAAVLQLKEAGLPYISILGDPSTGGAIASYAALGDVILAEPQAMVVFAGPRVMKSRGFPVDQAAIRAGSLHNLSAEVFNRLEYFGKIRGIHEVAERKDMKRVITKYLEFYR